MNQNNKIVSVLVFVISLLLPIVFYIFRDFFTQARSLGLLGIFIVNFVSSASFFPAPSFLSVVAGGDLYNPILVALISSLGATCGDVLFFFIGRSGRRVINHRLEKKFWFQVVEKYFKKHANWILILLSFVPNPFFDALGLLAGVFRYPLLRFVLIVTFGRFVRNLLLAYLGFRF